MHKYSVTLTFDSLKNPQLKDKHVRDGLSAVVKTGDYLWLSCDESITIERLHTRDGGLTYSDHHTFSVADYVHLPGGKEEEIDIEGLDYHAHYLWLVGSHSLKRKKIKEQDPVEKQIKRLCKIEQEQNRYLLVRIPLVRDRRTGEYTLHKTAPNPDHPERMLTAACLQLTGESNELWEVLKEDDHLKSFMTIPGKDNGFDIEGMTLYKNRILLGLRGPVLRGWAVMLEIEPVNIADDTLTLRVIEDKKYKKHFLDLNGMGIRSLAQHQRDLLILAGPTMETDGTIAVFRWKNALDQLAVESVVPASALEFLFEIPHGQGKYRGKDKAEGMTLISDHELLVVYDSPAEMRKWGKDQVQAEVFNLEGGS